MIHLHVHDAQGSFLDSTIRPHELPKTAKELGMKAIGITNHGYTSSHIDFYKACRKEGIKPILGCELYVCDDIENRDSDNRYDHLIVLAKNQIGYKNLLKLSSLGFINGFYYKPRVDMKTIEKYKEGLIITTACLGGEIPRMILKVRPYERIKRKVLKYAEFFEDFYLEVQSADNKQQDKVNKLLERLSIDTGVPLVASSDVHFLKKEDYELHGVFIQINQERDNEVYKDCWLKSEDEITEVLTKQIGYKSAREAIKNTHKIADMCNIELELGKSYLPDFPIPKGFRNEDEYLWHVIKEGFRKRELHKLSKNEQQIYKDRLRYEFKIIAKKGFSGYFLIVRDILKTCRENGILTGDGRGSADNSLVCYVVGITNVDSVKYDLNFSRFLTLERKSLPDIDLDLQSSRKQDLIKILKEKYGQLSVAQICTFQTLQAKAGIAAIGKVLGISYSKITEIKKCIPDQTSLKDALENSQELRAHQQDYLKLFEYTMKLEGLPRGVSVHAGGVVICPSNKEITDFTGLALSKDKEIITQLEMHNIEEVGLVKMDILGISTLDVVADTLKLIGKDIDYLDVAKMDFNDKKTYELLQKGIADGVFQLESSGMKETCKRVKPENMEDLIAILALYRPDTMGELEHYIKRKHGLEKITYLHSDLKPILEKTYGTMIYQEQVMAITKVFAGYSNGEADGFRKGIGKKDKDLVKKLAIDFRKRTLKNNYSEGVTNKLADDLEEKGGYMFNKGHSSGYAILSYKTAFLKANHKVEFMSALMTNQRKQSGATNYASVGLYTVKCRELGIEVKNPDVNLSHREFTPYRNSILYGLNLIKGIGDNAIDMVLANRPFDDFEEFIYKVGSNNAINKTVVVALLKSGAFDFTGESREKLLLEYGKYRFENRLDDIKPLRCINGVHVEELLNKGIVNKKEARNREFCLDRLNEWRKKQHLEKWKDEVMAGNEYSWEFQTLSYHLKGSPFEGYSLPKWDTYNEGFTHAKFFGTVVTIKKTKIKRGRQKGKTMAFIEFSTPEGMREGVCFSDEWSRLQSRLEKGNMVVVRGTKQGEKVLINGALAFDRWKKTQKS